MGRKTPQEVRDTVADAYRRDAQKAGQNITHEQAARKVRTVLEHNERKK